jgi:hypothetical protein
VPRLFAIGATNSETAPRRAPLLLKMATSTRVGVGPMFVTLQATL